MNKVCFVTGASRGIGKEVALVLAKEGYDIALNYRKETDELLDLKAQIQNMDVKCLTIKGDVTNFEDCKNMCEKIIAEFGRIDVLVNNAGITNDMLLMRMKEDDFTSVINVNLVGTFNITRNVINYMIKQKEGRIINISSIVGISFLFILPLVVLSICFNVIYSLAVTKVYAIPSLLALPVLPIL